MQQPLLKQHVERELIVNITPKINECLANLKENLKNKGYNVQTNKEEVSLSLEPNTLKLSVSGITAEKENTVSYSKFIVEEKTRIYDLIMLTTSILNWEARYGDSETMNFMYYYPTLKVEKKIRSEGTKIYILTDRSTQEKFMFATRSFAFPPGVTGQ